MPDDRNDKAAFSGGPNYSPNDSLDQELNDALGSMSLESLLELDMPQAGGAVGEGVRRGKVIAINGSDIFVDLGGKSQGVITADQFAGKDLPAVGDWIEVTIEGYDGSEGLLVLSRQGAVKAAVWQQIKEGDLVEGRVTDHNKGGLSLDINGIKAFMPISQISLERIESEELGKFDNQRLRCEVIEVRRDEHSLVVSHRSVLKSEEELARKQAFETLVEGQTVFGTVRTIMPYGAFVDIGGVDGLLHIGDMSHARVKDPHDIVTEGQQLELKVLKIDRDTRKIGLGLKQVMPDPWASIDVKYPVDTVLTGRVMKLMDFGAFVELEPGVDGLVPISEMSFERRIGHPREVISEGEVVKVRVLKVDSQAGRISLSIKRVGDDPWTGASLRWPKDGIVDGTVKRTSDFGAFIELTPGVEGLCHISELSDTRVRLVTDVLKVGQQVRVKVLEVEEDRRRISLSLKQAVDAPEYTPESVAAPDVTRELKKRKRPLKGGLEW
ncbi:MAG TPA: S1 RNA-binding domain-containing protein [Phycisphaerae bacterium]|nr:S1 RNA-binding domain-containing protein [Phycisphaerae bacterium]HSA25568.1 S1 RNA-binding domain-containing protein [Phycisphaerae bacterium]